MVIIVRIIKMQERNSSGLPNNSRMGKRADAHLFLLLGGSGWGPVEPEERMLQP